ncbi:MAG: hypothetical protein IJW03_05345 [Clostridia bacterium]|nr:hypothetical protein [Clostridia bacterium]
MIPTVASLALLLTVVAYVLSQLGFRGIRAFVALSIVAIMLTVSASVGDSISEIREIGTFAEMSAVSKPALKIIFVGYVFGFCSDIATELGEGGIANAITLGGRIEMILITLPYIKDIVKLAVELV